VSLSLPHLVALMVGCCVAAQGLDFHGDSDMRMDYPTGVMALAQGGDLEVRCYEAGVHWHD